MDGDLTRSVASRRSLRRVDVHKNVHTMSTPLVRPCFSSSQHVKPRAVKVGRAEATDVSGAVP
jgi:hypothetical protein